MCTRAYGVCTLFLSRWSGCMRKISAHTQHKLASKVSSKFIEFWFSQQKSATKLKTYSNFLGISSITLVYATKCESFSSLFGMKTNFFYRGNSTHLIDLTAFTVIEHDAIKNRQIDKYTTNWFLCHVVICVYRTVTNSKMICLLANRPPSSLDRLYWIEV